MAINTQTTLARLRRPSTPSMLVLLLLFVLQGCAGPTRHLTFPRGASYSPSTDANRIAIADFDFSIWRQGKPATNFQDDSINAMRSRLKDYLAKRDLMPLADGEGKYALRGDMTLKETDRVNALVVPAYIIIIGTAGLGIWLASALPADDYTHEAEANVTLIDVASGTILYSEKFDEVHKMTLNAYQARPKRLNGALANVADTVFLKLADHVSAAIAQYEQHATTGAGRLEGNTPTVAAGTAF